MRPISPARPTSLQEHALILKQLYSPVSAQQPIRLQSDTTQRKVTELAGICVVVFLLVDQLFLFHQPRALHILGKSERFLTKRGRARRWKYYQ